MDCIYQAINVIRNKYEIGKQECINLEKEKVGHLTYIFYSLMYLIFELYLIILIYSQAEKVVVDMEKKSEQKLSDCKEKAKLELLKIQREYTDLVCMWNAIQFKGNINSNYMLFILILQINKITVENEKKEESLKCNHSKELKR